MHQGLWTSVADAPAHINAVPVAAGLVTSDQDLSSDSSSINSFRHPFCDIGVGVLHFFAWGDAPKAEALDALAQPWNIRLAYAFPTPLCVVRKITFSSVNFLLVRPFWSAQKWFPAVLGLQVMGVRLPASPEVINLIGPFASLISSSTRLEDFRTLRGLCLRCLLPPHLRQLALLHGSSI